MQARRRADKHEQTGWRTVQGSFNQSALNAMITATTATGARNHSLSTSPSLRVLGPNIVVVVVVVVVVTAAAAAVH
jgi:hypothetical protein